MATIYVDKFTALEAMNSSLRIRHHSEYMQIQTSIERDDIQAIVQLTPNSQTVPSIPDAIGIKTSCEQVLFVPVWTDNDASVMLKALGDFWKGNT
jgi:hypothetical protein